MRTKFYGIIISFFASTVCLADQVQYSCELTTADNVTIDNTYTVEPPQDVTLTLRRPIALFSNSIIVNGFPTHDAEFENVSANFKRASYLRTGGVYIREPINPRQHSMHSFYWVDDGNFLVTFLSHGFSLDTSSSGDPHPEEFLIHFSMFRKYTDISFWTGRVDFSSSSLGSRYRQIVSSGYYTCYAE